MRRARSFVAVVATAVVVALVPSAPAVADVPNPVVEGPVIAGTHGRPWFSSLADLRPYGYVEQEFFLSGTSADLPYKTRIVVRRPVDPARFSGTVYVEWVNVTGGRDLETLWPAGHSTLLEEGHAYVVVSAQLVGHTELRAWDPVRYGTLVHPGDTPHSFNIFAQAIQAIRNPSGIAPLGDLEARYVIATGDSQSAGRLTTYITGNYPISGLIDGFMPGRGGGNAATGEVAAALQVPMLWLLEESQAERPADTDWQKFWYQAGAAHAPQDWAHYVWRSDMRDLAANAPAPDGVNAGCSVNRGEGFGVRGGIHWINRWVRGAGAPPTGPRLVRNETGALVRDADGHAQGGIRYPYIEAPIGVNSSSGCPLFGSYTPFSSSQIIARYPTKQAYVDAVTAAADTAIAEGFMVPSDRTKVVTEAAAFDVWSPGAALCHDLRGPVERANYATTLAICPPSAP